MPSCLLTGWAKVKMLQQTNMSVISNDFFIIFKSIYFPHQPSDSPENQAESLNISRLREFCQIQVVNLK
jgi:hypothetical protein